MKVYDEIKDMLCDELENITKRNELTPNALEVIDTSIDILKDIKTIEAMEQEYPSDGYSSTGGYSGYYRRMPIYAYDDPGMGGNSYARGRGSNAPRDSRGRYMSSGYSGDTREELQNLMDTAKTEREREAIRAALDHMNR